MVRKTFRRYLQPQVESDLARKMVFIGGPRQVGKTWLGKAMTDDPRAYVRYFRDIDGREVDFVLTERGKPIGFVECKLGDAPVSGGLKYLHARFPDVPAWQVSAAGSKDYVSSDGIRVCPAHELLRQLV